MNYLYNVNMKNDLLQRITELKALINPILAQYPVEKAGLFGSVLRDDFDASTSDIDILVEMDSEKQLGTEYLNMIIKLEEAVGTKVDLVQYKAVHPVYKKYILPSEVRIYEKNS